ncbi:hypothetical protein CBR_g41786 [Chara braunii]|uniref:Uncharacterized protein n=1 Tax=Chara braunii TaxID=69332 RepID=A0A388LWX5_CHABU|nr:hypothetical protein CBR_g41786 [Chara braunii]|eukprot:GBG86722.1 hypothetical protein CBR_g41786 [Chara braunii]
MKNYIDIEHARKEKKEKEKKEREKLKQEEREREQREEEVRLAREKRDEKRRIKKEKEKQKEVEFRETMRKELRMEVRRHVGGVCEELHHRLLNILPTSKTSKGKKKVLVYHSTSDEERNSDNSDVEALSEQAEGLAISEKRKRSAELVIGNSPPMETSAKRRTKRGKLDPKRLVLSCRHPSMKKPPIKKTPVGSHMKKRKIPATVGDPGKLRFVIDNLRKLGGMNVDELKQMCREEDVQFEGKKQMDTILAIIEKRTQVAYATNEEEEETIGDINKVAEELIKGGQSGPWCFQNG